MTETRRKLHIFDLNDDCLISVLSFLKYEDIFTLQVVHSRFNAAIAANLPQLEIEITRNNLKQVEDFFKIFGRMVKILATEWLTMPVVQEVITRYCNVENVNIKARIKFNHGEGECSWNLLRRLKSLELYYVHPSTEERFHRILDAIDNIEHLDIMFDNDYHVSPFLTKLSMFRHLKTLNIGHMGCEVMEFPKVNSLKTLHIRSLLYCEDIPLITYFPNIEDLTAHLFLKLVPNVFVNQLNELTNLKRLTLSMWGYKTESFSLLEHLANKNTLEHLELTMLSTSNEMGEEVETFEGDDTYRMVAILSRFTKVKSLHLRTAFEFNCGLLIDLVKPLTELRCLVLNGNEVLDLTLLQKEQLILELVGLARNLNKIQLRTEFEWEISARYCRLLYRKLVEAKANKGNETMLTVRICVKNLTKPLHIQRFKSVILSVEG